MTSVFTPTKMIHSLSLRQLNFLIYEFEDFSEKNRRGKNILKKRLVPYIEDFLRQTEKFKIEGLRNQTDRHLSLFREEKSGKNYFGNTYSITYPMSFAGLAQAQIGRASCRERV